MREIEVKARVRDIQVLITAVQTRGYDLQPPVSQHDMVYGLPEVAGDSNNAPWLRIRQETGVESTPINYFTLKRSVTGQLDSIEHEIVVNDVGELALIIEQLGFVPYSDLTKIRRHAHVDSIEICVDSVEGLGDFVEAELLVDDTTVGSDDIHASAVERLWSVLEGCGVSRSDQVTDGYDVLLNRLQGKQ